jgi:hypothetical protein
VDEAVGMDETKNPPPAAGPGKEKKSGRKFEHLLALLGFLNDGRKTRF